MRYYIGLDNGGTMTKAALYTHTGKEVGVESVQTRAFLPHPGWVERDMTEMRDANFDVLRGLLQKTGMDPADIAGIACCGHGKGLYLWGKDGKPVRPGIISTDYRALEYPQRWEKDGTAEKVYSRTFQKILACQAVSLLSWLKDHEPDCIDNIQWIFECKDYVRFCLTGEPRAELTDYSGANLVNLTTRDYDAELMALFGHEDLMNTLPPLCRSTDICGYVTAEAAARTGLKEGTPVAGGMFDIDACALAVGVTDESSVCMIAGTWSINEYIRKTPVTDGSVMMNSLFCLPEYYLIEECSTTSAANNEWFIRTLLPELAEQAKAEGRSIFDVTNEWVASVPPEAFCPVFLPFIVGTNVHPNAKAAFVGMQAYHARAHLVRSVYEGIAFSHKQHLDKLVAGRTEPVRRIRLAGGVARSKEWVQIFADVMGYPVELVDVNETGAFGCAMNVAVAVGDYADMAEAANKMISLRSAVLPDEGRHALYARKYAMYRKVIDALDGVWEDMQQLADQ